MNALSIVADVVDENGGVAKKPFFVLITEEELIKIAASQCKRFGVLPHQVSLRALIVSGETTVQFVRTRKTQPEEKPGT